MKHADHFVIGSYGVGWRVQLLYLTSIVGELGYALDYYKLTLKFSRAERPYGTAYFKFSDWVELVK